MAVADASGQVVRTLTLPPASGAQSFTWDGNTDVGTRAAAGVYTLTPVANVGGAGKSAELLLSGRVSSVTLDTDKNSLTLNTDSLGPIALDKVRSVM
jgi:flagellar hook assembly protein FlgD